MPGRFISENVSANKFSLVCTAALAAAASAAPPRVLVFNEPGYAASNIPGVPGGIFSSFLDGFYASPNGRLWSLRANATGQPTTRDTFYLSGDSNGIRHTFAENDVLPGIGFGLVANGSERAMFINDAGDLSFSGSFATGGFSNDECVARYNALTNNYTLIAQEGALIPGLGGERYGGILDAHTIRNNGEVFYRDSNTSGAIPSTQDEIIFRGDGTTTAIQLQSGVLTPTNQLGGTTNLLSSLDTQSFYASADLSNYMVRGNLNQAANSPILLVSNRVELQAGAPLPGFVGTPASGSAAVSRDNIGMAADGQWFAWGGTTVPGEVYLLLNGDLYLRNGDPVPGAPDQTLTSLEDVAISDVGDLAFLARTSLSRTLLVVDPAGNSPPTIVAFASGATLGTPCDLDGDGLADDDAFLVTLGDVSIGSDGTIYFIGRVVNSSFLTIGDGLFYVSAALPSLGDLNCDGIVSVGDIGAFVLALTDPSGYAGQFPACDILNGDINSDSVVSVGDIAGFVALLIGG